MFDKSIARKVKCLIEKSGKELEYEETLKLINYKYYVFLSDFLWKIISQRDYDMMEAYIAAKLPRAIPMYRFTLYEDVWDGDQWAGPELSVMEEQQTHLSCAVATGDI